MTTTHILGEQREHTTDYRGAAAAPLPGAATV